MNQHVKERKKKLIDADLTETDIARRLGVSQQIIHSEIRGEGKSERIRQAICLITKTKPEEFFPEIYGEKTDATQA